MTSSRRERLARKLATSGPASRRIKQLRRPVLDNVHVPSRYPNGHPEGAPFEHYGAIQSEEAIRIAGEVIDFVRARLA